MFGISKIVVTPPRMAARVPVSKSSLCVRPGSRKWTWVSTTPWHHDEPARVEHLLRERFKPREVADGRDPLTDDADVSFRRVGRRREGSAADEKVESHTRL